MSNQIDDQMRIKGPPVQEICESSPSDTDDPMIFDDKFNIKEVSASKDSISSHNLSLGNSVASHDQKAL